MYFNSFYLTKWSDISHYMVDEIQREKVSNLPKITLVLSYKLQ